MGDVAHQARKALEDKRDGHHAHLHDGALHLVGDAVDHRVLALDFAGEFTHAKLLLGPLSQIGQSVLRDHQFTDQVHQAVDLCLIYLETLGAGVSILGAAAELDAIFRRLGAVFRSPAPFDPGGAGGRIGLAGRDRRLLFRAGAGFGRIQRARIEPFEQRRALA